MADKDPNLESKLSKKSFLLTMTEEERSYLTIIAKLEGTSESNVLRRGLLALLQKHGVQIPEGLFSDKTAGNWLPKNDPQPVA